MSKNNRMKQRGGTRLKVLIGLLVVAALLTAGIRIVPVYVNAYTFRDEMHVRARHFGNEWPAKSQEEVRVDLYKKATELNLPIGHEHIQVSTAPEGIAIVVRFTVPVDLVVVQRELNFDFRTDSNTARR